MTTALFSKTDISSHMGTGVISVKQMTPHFPKCPFREKNGWKYIVNKYQMQLNETIKYQNPRYTTLLDPREMNRKIYGLFILSRWTEEDLFY